MKKKVLFIGSGNMASAIALGILDFCDIYTYSPSGNSSLELAAKTNGTQIIDLNECSIHFDFVFLAFKPQQLNDFINSNTAFLKSEYLFVSLLAGTDLSVLEQKLGANKVVRFMPNTPISLGKGAGLILYNKKISINEKDCLNKILNNVSYNVVVKDDDELNKLTTLSGCGPAYVYEFIKYYSSHFKNLSLTQEEILILIAKTFEGAALMIQHNEETIDDLINKVTSKGGVTIEAINHLRAKNIQTTIEQSLDKAYRRAQELSCITK